MSNMDSKQKSQRAARKRRLGAAVALGVCAAEGFEAKLSKTEERLVMRASQ
jgi:hypothetical protein